jgi:putative FmdB family regulatory protein
MPFYDYRCPTCDERFEVRRPIAEADTPTSCPQGHEGAVKVITSWGTGGAIRSGTPTKVIGRGGGTGATLERDAKKIAQHKRHGG